MSKFFIAKPPTDSNHEFQNMKLPIRPFVQLLAPDPESKNFIDVFNVPYNYFTDFSYNMDGQNLNYFTGKLTVSNPWPLSKDDVPRFKKFDAIMQRFTRNSHNLDQTEYKDRLKDRKTAIRWGWCDNDNDYYVSRWFQIQCSRDLDIAFGENGFTYTVSFTCVAAAACNTINIDRAIISSDIIESLSDALLKENILLDFNKEWSQYRVYKYDEYDNPEPAPEGGYLKSDIGRTNRTRELAHNNSTNNVYFAVGEKKLSDIFGTTIRAVCLASEMFETDHYKRKMLDIIYSSEMLYTGMWGATNRQMQQGLSSEQLSALQSKSELGFVQILGNGEDDKEITRVYLTFIPTKPNTPINEQATYDALFGSKAAGSMVSLVEKHEKDKVYEKILNSRDCGLYRYYAGSGVAVEGMNTVRESLKDNGEVRQSNVISMAVKLDTAMATYIGNTIAESYIDMNDGSMQKTGEQNINTVDSGSTAANIEDKNRDIIRTNKMALSACKQGKIANKQMTGTITILGDPSICGEQVFWKYIHLMAYDTLGNAIPYWSGLYCIKGFSHDISEGRYVTTLDVFLNDANPYNAASTSTVKSKEQ